jgi:hypothetical protein
MIRIHITAAAFRAIASSLGENMRFLPHNGPLGGYSVWLDKVTASQLEALRRPADSYSDVILRLAEMEAFSS